MTKAQKKELQSMDRFNIFLLIISIVLFLTLIATTIWKGIFIKNNVEYVANVNYILFGVQLGLLPFATFLEVMVIKWFVEGNKQTKKMLSKKTNKKNKKRS